MKRSSFLLTNQVLQIGFSFRKFGLPVHLVDRDDEGALAALVRRQELGQAFGAVWKFN